MKLDFSALAQPAAKVRGQVGTTGTPVSMRVCTSPLVQPGVGTAGDKPADVALMADLALAAPVARPHMSPACPLVTDAKKLDAATVSPASPLVPVETTKDAAAPFEREDAAGTPTQGGSNTCGGCLHLLLHGTCGAPVAAGLLTEAEGFGIVWPPEGYGAGCPAFVGKKPRAAASRSYGLTNDEAEPLTLRDRQGEDRRMCLECRELEQSGRCTAARRGALVGADRHLEPIPAVLTRCEGFRPYASNQPACWTHEHDEDDRHH